MKPTPPNPRSKRIVKINAILQAKLIKLLLEGTYTCQELAEMTGLHYVTVLQYTRELHREGAAHICGWHEDQQGRQLIKIYKIGAGKDVKRKRLTMYERQVRYRARKKQLQHLMVVAGKGRWVQSANGKLRFEELPNAA